MVSNLIRSIFEWKENHILEILNMLTFWYMGRDFADMIELVEIQNERNKLSQWEPGDTRKYLLFKF